MRTEEVFMLNVKDLLYYDIIEGFARSRKIKKLQLNMLIQPLKNERYAIDLKERLITFVCEIERKRLPIPIVSTNFSDNKFVSTSFTKVCYYFCYQLFNF